MPKLTELSIIEALISASDIGFSNDQHGDTRSFSVELFIRIRSSCFKARVGRPYWGLDEILWGHVEIVEAPTSSINYLTVESASLAIAYKLVNGERMASIERFSAALSSGCFLIIDGDVDEFEVPCVRLHLGSKPFA